MFSLLINWLVYSQLTPRHYFNQLETEEFVTRCGFKLSIKLTLILVVIIFKAPNNKWKYILIQTVEPKKSCFLLFYLLIRFQFVGRYYTYLQNFSQSVEKILSGEENKDSRQIIEHMNSKFPDSLEEIIKQNLTILKINKKKIP
jgi:hypothetical protein